MLDDTGHTRHALIVATSRYRDDGLAQLRAPAKDATDMAEVLGDSRIGQFSVTTVEDAEEAQIRRAIDRFLTTRRSNELALIYLSCHGLLDAMGSLYFAARDTVRDQLASTAIAWTWLQAELDKCRARQQILILDCCFSGAAGRTKSGHEVPVAALLGSRGRVVLTASGATEYSYEGEATDDVRAAGSLFTATLIDGLRKGEADAHGRGFVTVQDAYDYVRDRMLSRGLRQTPQINVNRAEGHIMLARSVRQTEDVPVGPPDTEDVPVGPPDDVRAVVTSAPEKRPARERLALQQPAADRPDISGQPARPFLTRRAAIRAGGGMAVAALSIAGWYWRRNGSPPGSTSDTELILRGHTGPVAAVAFDPTGKLLATGSYDGTARLWNLKTGGTVFTVSDTTAESGPVNDIAFNPDGASFATPGLLWNAQSGRQATLIQAASESSAYAVAFSPDGKTLATGYADGSFALSSVAGGQTIAKITDGHVSGFGNIVFSPDGQTLVTATGEAVRLWDVSTRRKIMDLDGQGPVAYAPDGAAIATSGHGEPTILLWDRLTGRNTAVFKGHSAEIWALSYHPDSKTLASASEDRTVRRWQLATGGSVAFTGHTAAVLGVAYNPDGTLLASGSEDGTARIWNAGR